MYLGVMNVIFGWYMTSKFIKLDTIFDRIVEIDREMSKVIGNKEKIRNIKRFHVRFEIICIITFTVSFVISVLYDIWTYPEWVKWIICSKIHWKLSKYFIINFQFIDFISSRYAFYIILFDLFPLIYPFAFSSLIILQFISLVKMIQLRFNIINE